MHEKRTTCRVCESRDLARFLELGQTALANSFLRSPEEFEREPRFPLDVWLCQQCGCVQLLDVIDPEVLFRDYIYVTGTSDTMKEHNRAYAATTVDLLRIAPGQLVVEVASNDGSLLGCFKQHGVRVVGIEPARNIAERARAAGIPTVCEFFGAELAASLRAEHGPARAVCANNVLAHVDDTRGFLAAARALIGEDGLVIVEVPYLRHFVERLEYDTVYHEHLCYFGLTPLMRACEEVDLRITRVEHVPVHGGSIRVYAGRAEAHADHAPAVRAEAEREQADGLTRLPRYQRFARDVAENRASLRAFLEGARAEGKRVVGYGAPAKGNTLLSYCGISTELLPYTVDKSPLKVGLWTPGTHIPVRPVEALLEDQPDYVLILAWNFAQEIVRQQAEVARRGARFVVPLPQPRVLNGEEA